MQRFTTFTTLALVLSLVVFATGCGGGSEGTVPVEGTLTIDGQPASGVGLTLHPVDPMGTPASGQVADGKFKVFTGNQGLVGAMPGKYKVVLYSTGGAASEGYGPQAGATESAAPAPKLPFPEKYASAETSDKEVEVVDGANNLTIEL